MSNQTKIQKLIRSTLNPKNLFCQSKYIFIFSHMRSRSTLLSHILGSNQEICGYNELHQSYEDQLSLLKMRIKLNSDVDDPFQNKFLLDKMLHNSYSINDQLLKSIKPKVIFLLRNAESSLQSIIRLGNHEITKEYKNPYVAMDYYCSRLRELANYASNMESGYFFIESDNLLKKRDFVLGNLTTWLDLKEPLREEYSTFSKTGKAGYGDMSAHIQSGVIHETGHYPKINFPMDVLSEARMAYESCKETLIKNQHYSPTSIQAPVQNRIQNIPALT